MKTPYDPHALETKWQSRWDDARLFEAPDSDPRPKFYMLEMFPYPSGRLHMGHVRNYSIGDVVARIKKKQGYNVMHPFGWDAFGLPAENAAIERGVHPAEWTYQNIREMRGQLKRLGLGYDWTREIATCHPEYYRWEQLIFIRALEKGLVYRRKALVNWSEKMQTVLANEQVIDGLDYRYGLPVVQKELTQWFFKTTDYAEELLSALDDLEGHWPERVLLEQRARIGKSHGTLVNFQLTPPVDGQSVLPVFTTRPDTLYGVTFMSLAPEHPMALKLAQGTPHEAAVSAFVQKALQEDKHKRGTDAGSQGDIFTGRTCINPINGAEVPIYIASYVLMDYGTGAVMAVPAHDQRDFDFARRFDLPVQVVINPPDGTALDPATMTEAYADDGVLVNSGPFTGLPNREAMTRITEHLAQNNHGAQTIHYRLRDWCVSRQRYWGAPIPVVYCDRCDVVPVPESQLPVTLPEDVDFRSEGGSPLARCASFVTTTCPQCGGPARRETDTFDTFVESSWYQLRYASPRCDTGPVDSAQVQQWLPVDQYIGGIEHAVGHLMYSRFYHRLMQDLGFFGPEVPREPFQRLLTQGMVCKETLFTRDANGHIQWHTPEQVDEDGNSRQNGQPVETGRAEKMSKSKHNGVDPEEIINRYGVDSARLFVLFASPPENDLLWKDEGVEGVHRFLGRVWHFVTQQRDAIAGAPHTVDAAAPLDDAQKEMRRAIHRTIEQVSTDVDGRFHFNTAIARCMELTNALTRFRPDQSDALGLAIQREGAIALLQLLSPFAPHICEELWEHLGQPGFIAEAPWPTFDPALAKADTLTIAVQVMGKMRGTVEAPADCDTEAMKDLALAHPNVQKHIAGKTIQRVIAVPGKLVNIIAR